MTAARAREGWLDVAEVGSLWGIRFVVGLCRVFGRSTARAFLHCLAAYYLVFHGSARRASRGYLTRLMAQATRGVIPEVVSLAPIPLELRPCRSAAPFSPLRVQHVYKPDTEAEATDE